MPELPEVETVVRGLRASVIGRTFTGAAIHWPREIASPAPDLFRDRIVGQRVEALDRRAKYIVFRLTHDDLLIHLKMTGRLYVAQPGGQSNTDDRWVRLRLAMDDGLELRFSDARKFGRVYLVAEMEVVTGRLGPEPLSRAFVLPTFQAALARRSARIKPLLLDQRFLAGMGNIYADEALWLAGIDPRRKADTLKPTEAAALYEAIRRVLKAGIRYEGASVSWYRKPDGTRGESQEHFSVYGREDLPCLRCGTPIRKIWLAQRGTHFCPHCQH